MTAIPLLIAAALYIWTAWGYVEVGRMGMAMAFVFYAFANVAFALDAWMPQ